MIQSDLEEVVLKKFDEHDRIIPRYDGYGLSGIPNTILKIFNTKNVGNPLNDKFMPSVEFENSKRVILFYIDGLRYDALVQASKDGGFFGKAARKGVVSPITTVFPSTTASANTTLNTGLTPLDHTLIEWQMYYHETGAFIYTLPFRPVTWRYEKQTRKLNPEVLFEGRTIHEMLRNGGTDSYVLVNRAIAKGIFSERVFRGSSTISHSYLSDCIVNLRKLLESSDSPFYAYVYVESADAIAHEYGPDSDMYEAEVNNISRIINEELVKKIDPASAKNTLIIFTSDHGQIPIKPEDTIYLNNFQEIEAAYEIHMGEKIPPIGSPRDVFLHIEPDLLDETKYLLEMRLAGKADVLLTSDAIKQGLFGEGQASDKFLLRSGNLVILPRFQETVWHTMKGMGEMNLLGLHGGLNKAEMLVPLGIANLWDLSQS